VKVERGIVCLCGWNVSFAVVVGERERNEEDTNNLSENE